jgi:hypothetical protein
MRVLVKTALVACLVFSGTWAHAQLSAEEAQKKLADKAAARNAQRSREVTVTQGELDDLRAELASLRAQVASMRGSGPAAAGKIEPIRAIAVGATRDQVMDFLRRHPNDYEVLANAVSTAHVASQTTITQIQRQGSNAIAPQTGSNVAANQNETTQAQQKTITEGERSEALTLLRKVYESVKTGSHQESNGVNSSTVIDTRKEWVPEEKLFVHFTENQVSSIDREAVTAANRLAVEGSGRGRR